jgi:hypothetical protein
MLVVALPLVFLFGCGPGPEAGTSDELTSKSAVERELTIKAFVYVDEKANSYTVQDTVQRQVRTAFGPLRIGKISVDDREFRNNIDPSTFSKTVLEVVKKNEDGSRVVLKKVARVSYVYTARALVDKSLAGQSSFSLALLMGNYQSFVDEIIKDCVENYEHDREFASSFWYVWAPAQYACKQRIQKEVAELNKEREGLAENQIGEKELARRYLPLTAELKEVAAPKTTYPEYNQLYGIDDAGKSRIVVYQILGVASHSDDPIDEQFENDMGFKEYFKLFKTLAGSFKTLKVAADSQVNPLSVTYGGKTYTGTFADLYSWTVSQTNFPSEVTDTRAFRRAIHDHVHMKWVKLEVPLSVTSARGSKKMTLEIRLIFGTEGNYGDRAIWREAFKNADVALYDGHSYIGSGPLDPANYSAADFSNRYQILFFNSCVSFNYYGVNYFKLKSGGTKNLDLVTNGLEVWINNGGVSMAQFIAALFNGKQSSWLTVLEKTAISSYWGVHDPNRNVDGELDNTYDPSVDPITVEEGDNVPPPAVTVKNTSPVCGGTATGTVELSATATNAARVEFLVGTASLGSDATAPYAVAWNSTTTANGTVKVIARAYAADGSKAEDSCTVTVQNGGGGTEPIFFDDMESGTGNWTATGIWHLAQSSKCASPAYASPVSAWYFGQDQSCNYQSGGTVKGTLTSKLIAGVTATSKLSFKFYREVENTTSGSYDKTRVEVQAEGSTSWKTLWTRDSKVASTKTWESSGELSLAEYAGKSIRIRFSFDSVDSYENAQVGWLVDDVLISP